MKRLCKQNGQAALDKAPNHPLNGLLGAIIGGVGRELKAIWCAYRDMALTVEL